ncbi:MAG: VCBS repeat-containing protein [Flavobacteriaceae bacterium]
MIRFLKYILLVFVLFSCESKKEETLFKLLDPDISGIKFQNNLKFDNDFNVYKYRNYYNGGGVSIGDIDNDGLQDVYMTSNLNSNKLYKNLGNMKFLDITDKAMVGGKKAWSTGVTMVDINHDGFLDIYVCNSGDIKGDNKQNELFINNGDGTFLEKAKEYNLDDIGFSTHSSFFDFDKDGDLDVYLLNNSYQSIESFNLKKNERPNRDILGGDKLLENRDGKFFDISEESGIYGSVIGFGLGVTVADFNRDGWEDIFVSNDFFERDYLYMNNKNGTFSEELINQIQSISGASMGADAADIDNDGFNDLFVTEMLPSEYKRLKTVTTFEDWNKYQYNVKNGYYHQFTRNVLQHNNKNNSFSEIGRYSGVEASDWSWGALFFDMNNDGLKDLFIANGIFKDLTNQDYLQYVSNEEVVKSIVSNNKVDYKRLVDMIPSNKVENHAYLNLGNLEFERDPMSGLEAPSFSNGAAYGDLDNDGDLDLIVNNVNMISFVYENKSNENKSNNFLKIILKGSNKNLDGIGAQITVKSEKEDYYIEQQPARGFQSSMDNRPNFGLSSNNPVSIEVLWPSLKISKIDSVYPNQTITIDEKNAKENTTEQEINSDKIFYEKNQDYSIDHNENVFVDFHRNRLMYHMCSTEGPAMAVADINNDGKKEIFMGGSKGFSARLYDLESGKPLNENSFFEKNKFSEDSESIFFDADNDGDQDLFVASGGIEFSPNSTDFSDRLYINNGKGVFSVSDGNLDFKKNNFSTGAVAISDIDLDGDLDIFIGQRLHPFEYGIPGSGYIYLNDGEANFKNGSGKNLIGGENLGMITDAIFEDLDNDGFNELIVVGEFMGVEIFKNKNGVLSKMEDNPLSEIKGWWNVIFAEDFNGDGLKDIIVGNHGTNSRV